MSTFDTTLAIDLFNLFSRVETDLAGRSGCAEAIQTIQSFTVIFKTLEGLDETARSTGLQGLLMAISPLQGNGVGDAVIWPALRKSQLHSLAEELTAKMNAIRASLYADCQVFVPVAESPESKVRGLKEFFQETYGEMDEDSLISALDDVIYDAGEASVSAANNGGLDAQLSFLVKNGWTPADVQSAASRYF